MAGEWLKMELSTPDKPEVLRMARLLELDKDAVLGKLFRIWAWFDKNSVDGHVDGVVSADVDEIVFKQGFACVMHKVEWLEFDDEAQWIRLPNFDRHNGETAKNRALKAARQSKWRANSSKNVDDKASTSTSTKTSTREEKRREDINTEAKASMSDSSNADVKAKRSVIPYEKIVGIYHQCLPSCPKVEILTSKRRSQIGARWSSKELDTLESWESFFNYCSQSKFLMGAVDPAPGRNRFIADLEWLTKESNYTKIVEGKYHG